MKKIILLFGVFLFTLSLNSNIVSASDDLFVDGDYISRDPITNKYSSDWSHLDTSENLQLQKEVREYFSQLNNIGIQSESRQLNLEHDLEDLNKRIDDFLSLIDPEIAAYNSQESNLITPMSSYGLPGIDQTLVKIYEGRLHLAIGNLTPSNIATAIQNSNAARDHGIRYAENNNFYSNGKLITWENAADALRHFAWNYMNSNDFGVAKAKTTGDIHELALIALKYVNNDVSTAQLCKFNMSCMEAAAIQKTINNSNLAKTNITAFNNIFDNASVMDLINNAKGRQAYSQGNATYSVPFNRMLASGELVKALSGVNSTVRNNAWVEYK
ncbi:hypothetical protein [Metasolibacillus meyeri]|uniref:hypothetical protein n=1 Tax=Metasolibacillus meyeri TaxID=1071052 RepID=UPI0012902536|nr:hypothetical protein [Metasolibacillus meyeri]